jgi:hypothetical protein
VFRLTAFLSGAAAFTAAHAVEVIAWRDVFAPVGDYAPWFLNAGRAVAFTAACLFCVSIAHTWVARSVRDSWMVAAASLTIGAVVAMTVVLALSGPGTIFPLALAIGALIAAAACGCGGLIGARLSASR